MTGYTQSNSGIATAGAHQTANGNSGYNDAFLLKFNGISLGINENINDKLFTIYPNPAFSILNINADYQLINQHYTIIDGLGRVILNGKLNEFDTAINVEQLSKGIYYLKVSDRTASKFIKE
jgi:hypothetical protein